MFEETYRNAKLLKNFAETPHLVLHLCAALVPEPKVIGLFKSNGGSFLERRHATVANPSVCTGNIFDQMLRANEVSHTPTGGIECLAG